MLDLIRRVRRRSLPRGAHASYSQCGEDMILAYLLETNLGVDRPTYLDIGGHHPSYLSNTNHFYQRGFSGVVVEPDPELCAAIRAARPRDTCVNAGIGIHGSGAADFHVMDDRTLNTFLRSEVDAFVRQGRRLERTISVPMLTVADLVRQHCPTTPHLMSIDTEGLDLDILRSIDFATFRPTAICVETMDHERQVKLDGFAQLMAGNGYEAHSDTYLNTIFVDRAAWSQRRGLPPLGRA